jgi:hypothetical protein
VPYIAAAGELKTKPTQHSVKELRSIGIQPDVLLCRSERPLPESERRKIALFTNVHEKAVISAIDLDNIYKIPLWLHEQQLDQIVVDRLRLKVERPRMNLGMAARRRNLSRVHMRDEPLRDLCEVRCPRLEAAIRGQCRHRRSKQPAVVEPDDSHLPHQIAAAELGTPPTLELGLCA